MKKFVALGVAFLSFSLSLSQVSHAEMVDARSVALGGTTLGTENGAFAPLRNPASMVNLGWGSFILPFSPTINIGANTNTFNSFIPPGTGASGTNNYLQNLFEGFSKNPDARLEAQSVLPVLGFSGSPFPNLAVMGKPVAFGLNLWGKASAYGKINMSPGLISAISGASTLFNDFNMISAQSQAVGTQFTSLGNGSITFPDFTRFASTSPTDINGVNALADEAEKFQNNTLKPLISTSDTAVNTFTAVSTQLSNLLNTFDALSTEKQSGKANIAADGHGVVALSGATRVFKNNAVDLSVGVNLKGFFFPSNPQASAFLPAASLGTNPLGALVSSRSSAKLFPITVSTDLQLGPFKSINEIKTTIDTKISPFLQGAAGIVSTAKELDQQFTTAIPKARVNGFSVIGDIPGIQANIIKMQAQSSILNKILAAGFTSQVTSGIMASVVNDLKDVKFSVDQVNEVAPLGFGVDLGFQARIIDDVVLGLVLENPLVVWPAKMTTNDITFNSDATSNPSQFNASQLFKVSQGSTKDTNYNLTEPMALRFGGSYNLGKLTPYLNNALILADVEQVFNGRPFAVHLGVEKGWLFGPAGIFGRLGTQIGGLGNVVTMGLGFKGGPFNIDFGYGASNPFNPGGSNAATAALSTSLNF